MLGQKTMKNSKVFIAIFTAVVACQAWAQTAGPAGGKAEGASSKRGELGKAMKNRLNYKEKKQIREDIYLNLKLDKTQEKQVADLEKNLDDQLKAMRKDLAGLRGNREKGDKPEKPSPEMMEKFKAMRQKAGEIEKNFAKELSKILKPEQMADFKKMYEEDVRKAMEKKEKEEKEDQKV